MKRLFFLSVLFLASCGQGASVSTSFSSTVSFSSSGFSEESSSSQFSSSISFSSSSEFGSSEGSIRETTVSEIRAIGETLVGSENEVGVAESDCKVSFVAKMYSCLDAVTTKSGYGNRYKILVADTTGYLYVKVPYASYEYLTKYDNQYGCYRFEGTVSLYNGEVEVTSDLKPVYLNETDIAVDWEILAEENDSLETVYRDIYALKTNTKGIAFSGIVGLNLLCLARDFENTNVYLTDGKNIVNMHGNAHLYTKFTPGFSYHVYAAKTIHNFRPGLEFVAASVLEQPMSFQTEDLQSMTASEFYRYTYQVDKNDAYPSYSALFENAYRFEGYVNYYEKDGKIYMVLEDAYKENSYSSYTAAKDAKAVFLKNKNCVGIQTEKDEAACELLSCLDGKVEMILFPYLWNTLGYFQVYYYSCTLI